MKERDGYIPTLDGWRTIAIIGIFFAHSQLSLIPMLGNRVGYLLQVYGGDGVDLFFAISGLLICTRLLEEEARRGRISLRGFYIRRAFRILPPALLYLVFIGILGLAGLLVVSKLDWFASLFFFRNYTVSFAPPAMHWWFTSHYWSLSVEEHFYFILPALLVFLPRWRLTALGILVVLVNGWKWHLLHDPRVDIVTRFHSDFRLDELLIPAMLAVWLKRGNHEWLMRRLMPAWSFPVVLAAYGFCLWRYPYGPQTPFFAALLLLSTIYNPRMFVGRFLEWAPMRWVGRLSYSLYLWQMFFCCGRPGEPLPFPHLQTPPLNFVLIFACAITSFYLVERPAIRLGHRLAKPVTPGHEDVAVAT